MPACCTPWPDGCRTGSAATPSTCAGHGRSDRPADGNFAWSGFGVDVLTVVDRLGLQGPFGVRPLVRWRLPAAGRTGQAGHLPLALPLRARGGARAGGVRSRLGRTRCPRVPAGAAATFPSFEDAFVNFSSKPPFGDLDPEVAAALRGGRLRGRPRGRRRGRHDRPAPLRPGRRSRGLRPRVRQRRLRASARGRLPRGVRLRRGNRRVRPATSWRPTPRGCPGRRSRPSPGSATSGPCERPATWPPGASARASDGPRRHTPVVVSRRALRTAPVAVAVEGDVVPRLRPGLPVHRHRAAARPGHGVDRQGNPGPQRPRGTVLEPPPGAALAGRRLGRAPRGVGRRSSTIPTTCPSSSRPEEGRRLPGRRRAPGGQLLPPGGPRRGHAGRHRAHARGAARRCPAPGHPGPARPHPRRASSSWSTTRPGGLRPTAYMQAKLIGVQTYALLCQEVLGRRPVQVRLLHLKEPTVITAEPTEQGLRGQRTKTLAVWSAIERACRRRGLPPEDRATVPILPVPRLLPRLRRRPVTGRGRPRRRHGPGAA